MLDQLLEAKKTFLARIAPIEAAKGFHIWDYPLDVNDVHAQEHLRVLAWRLTEEIFEARDAYFLDEGSGSRETPIELADVLHFLVELGLALGITKLQFPADLEAYLKREIEAAEQVSFLNSLEGLVRRLSVLLRLFRQRPWRREIRPRIQRAAVFTAYHALFVDFFRACALVKLSPTKILDEFFKKNTTNYERQEADEKLTK